MALSKASESSVKINVSPATIALAATLILQTVAVVWWAQGVTKDIEVNKKTISDLQSELGKQQVYINDTREKFIKMQAIVEGMQQKEQLQQLLKDKEK